MDYQRLQYYISQMQQGDFSNYTDFYAMTSQNIYRTILDIVGDQTVADTIIGQVYDDMYKSINDISGAGEFEMWARNKAVHHSNLYLNNGQAVSQSDSRVIWTGPSPNEDTTLIGPVNESSEETILLQPDNGEVIDVATNEKQSVDPWKGYKPELFRPGNYGPEVGNELVKKRFFGTTAGKVIVVISTVAVIAAGVAAGIFAKKYFDSRNDEAVNSNTTEAVKEKTTEVAKKDTTEKNNDATTEASTGATTQVTTEAATEVTTEAAFEPYDVTNADWTKFIRGNMTKEDMEVEIAYLWNLCGESYNSNTDECIRYMYIIAFLESFTGKELYPYGPTEEGYYGSTMNKEDFLNILSSFSSSNELKYYTDDIGYKYYDDGGKIGCRYTLYEYEAPYLPANGEITEAVCYGDYIEAQVTVKLYYDYYTDVNDYDEVHYCTAKFISVGNGKYRLDSVTEN